VCVIRGLLSIHPSFRIIALAEPPVVMWCVVVIRGLLCIHPSFRIVALAEPPVVGSTSQQWLNAEQLTVFLYHNMRSLLVSEELYILNRLVSGHMFDSFSVLLEHEHF